ncbi:MULTISPECIES: D-alanine--D-alanine ligase family protein [Thermoanaerobacter]|jgi:D-alanine-D-alanine ligase|uniref:D-alanine--D-alanine ligase n=2 Tax=Thermoanaerobacter TaxID=1754 RepID=B0K7X8_THEP3|nr:MULTISPECIES: ATP-grasp domain-containing protein [Thermoanaerobacter]ABY95798.1 D-alanine--D-alanine ligase [Thermoanaerobacter pseudethanolicus ATCC 33223]ADV80727.1 D-alanine--D-alanine ligase [Thermoanaerobacter brockii subsp. finnii Ako-1]MBZ4655913.1 D-alanine--D-alanine ligase [Thermoanaerobacter sp.]MDI3501764.1 D-alanine-D-alanine ligase [Thermoanaerobacter sp.]MDI3529965.1 D-alanine-D-alanine ligase [Thermoanaerobacter sp.]
MKIGVLWRKFRNVEFQRKLTPDKVYDDAYDEAYHHYMAIKEAGFDSVLIEWKEDPLETYETIKKEKVDLIFNASSMKEVAFLEVFNIPYVGSGLDVVATDKRMRKDIVASHGLPTPKYVIAENPQEIPSVDHLKFPLFVKPISGRGSAGIDEENIIYDKDKLPQVVSKITEKIGQAALIEEFIEGKEVTVGIIGYKHPQVLPLLEVGYNNVKTNTYEHKMFDNEIIKCPIEVPKEVEEKIKETALNIYKVLNAKDFARIDMILSKDNVPYFLELNTFAGLTMSSSKGEKHVHHGYMGYMAKAAGLTRGEFIGKIIESAIERYKLK